MVTILLVRHARAGRRDSWVGDDRLRPLSKKGKAQAQALPGLLLPLLEGQGVRLVSSPWSRCMETLEPLGAALGVEVGPDDTLAEGMAAKALEALPSWGREGPTVLCTHGDVVLAVLGELSASGVRVRPRATAAKGSVWYLTGADAIEAARYLPPPA